MTRFIRANWFILGLASLAAVQIGFLGLQLGSSEGSSPSWFQVGDTLSGVRAFDSNGRETSFASGDPTVLMVFHSDCGHCENVALLWRDWTAASGRDVRTVAFSSESLDSARAYAVRHEWGVDVWTVGDGRLDGLERVLTSRTLWVFVLDKAGVILAEGHGNRIAELGAVVWVEINGAPKL